MDGGADVDAIESVAGVEDDVGPGRRPELHAMRRTAEHTLCGRPTVRLPEVGPWGWVPDVWAPLCGDCLRLAPLKHPRLHKVFKRLEVAAFLRARRVPEAWWTWTSVPKTWLGRWGPFLFRVVIFTQVIGTGVAMGLGLSFLVYEGAGIAPAAVALVLGEGLLVYAVTLVLRPGARMAVGPDGLTLVTGHGCHDVAWSEVRAFDVVLAGSGDAAMWMLVVHGADGPRTSGLWDATEPAVRRLADRLNAALDLDSAGER